MTKDPAQITLSGAPEGYDAALLAREARARAAPVIHVARDDRRMAAMRAALSFVAPDLAVLDFPAWDTMPYDRVSPAAGIQAARLATLAALASGGLRGPFVVLTTLSAAMQRVPARETLRNAAFSARVGDRLDEAGLRAFLARMGFSPAPTVTEPGDYAIRGGIIDIYPPAPADADGGPIRLDLFGDTLDGARRFDPETQRTTGKLDKVTLAPMSEVILDEDAIARFRQSYRAEFGASVGNDPLYEAISAGQKAQGAEHWLPWFHDRMESLFDYLPDASVMLDDRVEQVRAGRWETISEQYSARREALGLKDRSDTVYKPIPPAALFPDEAEWTGWLKK